MTLDEIWEQSRVNEFSCLFPVVIYVGLAILFCLVFIKNKKRRLIAIIAVIIILTMVATEVSSMEIFEKWRIRWEWYNQNESQLSESDKQCFANRDGANLTLGPILYGIQAMFIFSAFSGLVWMLSVSPLWQKKHKITPLSSESIVK